jgi:shikimate dehydrogenase
MKRLCVIGDPVGHSLSPVIHNAALEHLGLQDDYAFERVKVARNELADFVARLRKNEFAGVSVTMPHKTSILPMLDRLSEEARLIGAVNTVVPKGCELVGHNTDGAGCVRALEAAGVKVHGRTVAVLGAGGAARAIAVSLALERARKIFIINRTLAAAEDIVEIIRKIQISDAEAVCLGSMQAALAESNVLVNATPVGMSGADTETIVPKGLIRRNMDVFDIVYEPMETQLIKDAKKAGNRTIPGSEMLLHQGALQFKLFTDQDAPLDVMRAALEARL